VSLRSDYLREHARRALPPVEGNLGIAGLRAPVEILRDRWGVAHIYAQNVHDLYLAQGYWTASERLFQIDLILRATAGRLSAMFGESTLQSDRWARLTGDPERVVARIEREKDDLSREIGVAYSLGVHAWIARMPVRPLEYEVLEVDPDLPGVAEMSNLLAAAWLLTLIPSNFDLELLRTAAVERLGWEGMLALFPSDPIDPTMVTAGKQWGQERRTAAELLQALPAARPGRGSNCWVVAGWRSHSGKPLVATDSHVGFTTPSSYYEVHLSAPGIDVSGVTAPALPAIFLGRTPVTAWAATSGEGDCQDLYLERLNDDRTAALYLGEWEPLTVRTERIEVRGRSQPDLFEVRQTRHGPLLDAGELGGSIAGFPARPGEAYAFRWVSREQSFNLATLHRMATARSFPEFREALRGWTVVELNTVFADIDGNIGYQLAGVWPTRKRGDGTMPVPGWTDEYEWTGLIPYEELPFSFNPEIGFLATANNRTWAATYPHNVTRDTLPPYRVRRIAQLLAARETHDFESFEAMQLDTVSLQARELLPLMLAASPEGTRQDAAHALLRAWDYDVRADAVAATLYEVWLKHLAAAMLQPKLGAEVAAVAYARCGASQFATLLRYPSATWFGRDGAPARDSVLRAALDAALDELTQSLGPDLESWRWGRLHNVRLLHTVAGYLPQSDPDVVAFLTAGEGELGGDGNTVNNGGYAAAAGYTVTSGAGVRYVIDLADPDTAVGVTIHGQSGNPASPHWNDQVALRIGGGYHPMPLTRPAVEALRSTTLRLDPA
jgi:penicillin amidase